MVRNNILCKFPHFVKIYSMCLSNTHSLIYLYVLNKDSNSILHCQCVFLRSVQCLFSFETKIIKEELSIFIIVTIAWILWVIIFQISNRDTTGLFFLFILFNLFKKVLEVYQFISL